LACLTASQFGEWIAYAELEPFGSAHETKLVGMICATIANFSDGSVLDKKTGKRKQIGKVEATIGCGIRVNVEKQRNKERAVYCVSPLDIWDAVQKAIGEKNIITK